MVGTDGLRNTGNVTQAAKCVQTIDSVMLHLKSISKEYQVYPNDIQH